MIKRPNPDFWRGRRVLLTGHTGFKGCWLAVWLRELGAEVTGLALDPATDPSMFAALAMPARMTDRRGDIRDLARVTAVLREARPEIVFHLAAQPIVRASYAAPAETYATNVLGTTHVLEAARAVGAVEAIVVVTSDKCYENREWPFAYRETDALGGFDPYSSSKACTEIVAQAYRRSFGMRIATARAGNVIGGGDWSVDRIVCDAARALARGEPVEVRNPRSVRPWQHVLEPLRGYLVLAEAVAASERFADAWNFGPEASDAVPVADLIDGFVARWGDGATWKAQPREDAPHEAKMLRLDCGKARDELGWVPSMTLAQALEATVAWYRLFYARAEPEALHALTRAQISAADGRSPPA